MAPFLLVQELPPYLSHTGVGLNLGATALHHARDVQVFDDQALELADQLAGHPVLGVLPEPL